MQWMWQRLTYIPWTLIATILALIALGLGALYSAAGGHWSHPWLLRQGIHFLIGIMGMVVIITLPKRWIFESSYILYTLCIGGLLIVALMGMVGMGAQRWLDLKFFRFQPSEMTKIGLVLALARFFASQSVHFWKKPTSYLIWIGMVGMPVILIMKQPDLGTALFLLFGAASMIFIAGLSWWIIVGILSVAGGSAPLLWSHLHDYQKKRIMTFIAPDLDPLGASYHTHQAKIALGAGGLTGQGILQGTQNTLNFLPEKHTDSIFCLIGEEWGFLGTTCVLLLYIIILIYGFRVTFRARDLFARLASLGFVSMIFCYIFLNTAMITGILPMVGIPLPMMSYGGSATLSFLMMLGFLVHFDLTPPLRDCR